ncbi:hypothetical protein ACFY41_14975 [Streptomyces syringium]|uniref:hypothetical protein n=1 Tax=Streptomyces syringium TaxID=76729 RepID=UPI00369F7906
MSAVNHGHEIAIEADAQLFEFLYVRTAMYVSLPCLDPEFADVLSSSMLAEALVREGYGEYPPVGHDYPRIGR